MILVIMMVTMIAIVVTQTSGIDNSVVAESKLAA